MAARRRKPRVREAMQEVYRDLVLEAASQLFAEKGYEDARMEEIARRAGLALGTVYSVFSGKQEIHERIHELADRELLQRAMAAGEGAGSPLEAVLAGIRTYAEYFLDHPDFLRMQLRHGLTWGAPEPGSRPRSDAWTQGVDRMIRLCERGVEAGTLIDRDPRLLARTMVAILQVQLAHWLETGMQQGAEAFVREVSEQVQRALCVDRPEQGR